MHGRRYRDRRPPRRRGAVAVGGGGGGAVQSFEHGEEKLRRCLPQPLRRDVGRGVQGGVSLNQKKF